MIEDRVKGGSGGHFTILPSHHSATRFAEMVPDNLNDSLPSAHDMAFFWKVHCTKVHVAKWLVFGHVYQCRFYTACAFLKTLALG